MTTGEGGIITTNDTELVEAAKIIRNHGMVGRDNHMRLGYNNRMTEMEAAMGLVQLGKLDQLNQKRITNSHYILDRAMKLDWVYVPTLTKEIKHTYFWCPLMVKEDSGRTIEELKEHLAQNQIGFRARYHQPLYKQPVLKKLGLDYSQVRLPNAERIAGQVIGLPNHPGLTFQELDRLVNVLAEF